MTTSNDKRRQDRRKAVIPVRVRGIDVSGKAFEELVHTLDVTPAGVRLGSIRHQLKALDQLTVFYRKRKLEFRVIWTKMLSATEYQVGLQAVTEEREAWGVNLSEFKINDTPLSAAPATASQVSALA
jgi:hypothetical protein